MFGQNGLQYSHVADIARGRFDPSAFSSEFLKKRRSFFVFGARTRQQKKVSSSSIHHPTSNASPDSSEPPRNHIGSSLVEGTRPLGIERRLKYELGIS